MSTLQQLGAARKYGRAPPTQQSRELQQWLDTLLDKWEVGERDLSSKPEVVVDGAERGSATYVDDFKGEHRVSFSALVSCFFGGKVLVGRREARREVCVSLADFFDVERNLATTLSRCSLLVRVWRKVDLLGSEHLVFLTTAPRLGYLG